MPTFETTTSIAALPRHVRNTLIRTDRRPDRDPAPERVDGTLGAGGSLCIHVASTSRPFRVRVTTGEPDRRIVVVGRTLPDLPPSFDAFASGLRTAAEQYRSAPNTTGDVR